MAKFRLSQIVHLCSQKCVCDTNFGPFGEFGAYFPVQLSSQSHFANIFAYFLPLLLLKHKKSTACMDPLKLIFKISILEANKQTKAKKKKPIVFASFILAWYKSKRVNY